MSIVGKLFLIGVSTKFLFVSYLGPRIKNKIVNEHKVYSEQILRVT
jgi:hypothetical protein